ncbi:MAG: putative porin [Sphingomonadales bacterium]|nr:putative porin [Sphingomonadales bacterium]
MSNRVRGVRRLGAVSAFAIMIAAPTYAQAQSADDFAAMRAEIAALKAQQQQSAVEIEELKAKLAGGSPVVAAQPQSAPVATTAQLQPTPAAQGGSFIQRSPQPAVFASAAAPVNPAGGSAPGTPPASVPSKLTINGDFRLRYESNFGDQDARNRDRGVLRARLRAAYAVNKWLTVGGQLSTGDADDPNSTDITLSNFNDDLDVSLDQAYAKFSLGNLTLYGGKIPQPFVRTELVWDGDVSPQGVSASYKINLGGGASLKANALYFLIDESVAGKNSDMVGGQLAFETSPSAPLKFELAAGYYDYQLGSTAGGDTGDFRSNRFLAGRYLSDFDLLDVIGAVQFNGLGEKWPVRVVGDYVHNFGATVPGDSGFGVDLLVGRASKKGDLRFGYGYAQTGVDAVFAAFSHDNTNIATNYRQHTLFVDFVPIDNIVLNATFYRYRPKDALYAGSNGASDWLDRLRLNMLVNF